MSYEKALSLVSGGGSGVTVFPIVYDEGGNAYVEAEPSEVNEAAKNGAAIFADISDVGTVAYYVVNWSLNESRGYPVYSISANSGTPQSFLWTYANGKYVMDSGD